MKLKSIGIERERQRGGLEKHNLAYFFNLFSFRRKLKKKKGEFDLISEREIRFELNFKMDSTLFFLNKSKKHKSFFCLTKVQMAFLLYFLILTFERLFFILFYFFVNVFC